MPRVVTPSFRVCNSAGYSQIEQFDDVSWRDIQNANCSVSLSTSALTHVIEYFEEMKSNMKKEQEYAVIRMFAS